MRIGAPQIVALLGGHHLERQLVVVPEEDRPLAILGDVRGLPDDVGDGMAVFLRHGHVHARHQREVECHVAFVALAEIGARVLRPLIGFGQQHAVGIGGVEIGADLLQDIVRLRQVLVVGAVALHQIGNGVEPQPVDAHLQPEAHDAQHFLKHTRIVEVEVRLVRIEAVPEEGMRLRVPGPVGLLGVDEDDAGAEIMLVGVAPDIEVARRRARLGMARLLEPGMLVGGVVDDQLGDHADAAAVRLRHEAAEVAHAAIGRVDRAVVGYVVAVVAQRRGVERQHPDDVDAKALDIVEALHKAGEVTHAVAIGVEERLDVELVDDGVLVPIAHGAIDHALTLVGAGRGGLGRPLGRRRVHYRLPPGISRQIA